MITKVADSKGRIALGSQFAGKTFIVRQRKAGVIVIEPAVVLPEREAWLYQNKAAFESVKRGIEQAANHEFSTSPPDLEEDDSFVAGLDD